MPLLPYSKRGHISWKGIYMASYCIIARLLILPILASLTLEAAGREIRYQDIDPHHPEAQDSQNPPPTQISISTINDIITHELRNQHFDNAIKLISSTNVPVNLAQARTIVENHFKLLQAEAEPKDLLSIDATRSAVFARLAEIDMHQGNENLTNPSRNLLLPERRTPSFGAFLGRHTGKLGLGIYQGLDGALQYNETTKKADGLSAKTAREVQDGFKPTIGFALDGQSSISSVARAVRPVTSIGYGLMPWAREIAESRMGKALPGHHHEFRKQSNLSKVAGAANLATLGINGLYNFSTRKNSKLNAKDAYLLSYLNRRHGVPLEITKYKKDMSKLAKARWLIRVVGLAALPGLLAVFTKGKHAPPASPAAQAAAGTVDGGVDTPAQPEPIKMATSPAMLVGNLASIADSLMGIFEQYRTQHLIKSIKKATPFIEEELRQRPPTPAEKEADKEAADDMDFSSMMPSMMGGF